MTRYKAMFVALLIPAVLLIAGAAMAESVSGLHVAQRKVIMIGKCPYNLDKECTRLPNGRLVHCRCVS